MLLTKEVEVKPSGKSIQYYKDKGYDAKWREPLVVRVEDLPEYSKVQVSVLCDYCKEEIIIIPYYSYLHGLKTVQKTSCKNCTPLKTKESNMINYGVASIMQLDSVKEKIKNSNLEKYGVENYSSTKECREKVSNTMLVRYGVDHVSKCEEFLQRKSNNNKEKYGVEHTFQVKEFRDKGIQTNLQKYGVEYASQSEEVQMRIRNTTQQRYGVPFVSQSDEIKEKVLQTNLKRYGVKNPSQLPEIREKMAQTLYANSSQKASKQQRYICELYHGILNYPVKYYCADIYLPDDNLTVEYNGNGHMLNVITGRETMEEYTHKEIVRYNVIKREGYKQVTIVNNTKKLPSDTVLLQMLQDARTYFSNYPNHSWYEFNIDTSFVYNAENKNGIPYDYGELRTIKN